MRHYFAKTLLQPDVLAKSKSGRSVFHDAATRLSKSGVRLLIACVFYYTRLGYTVFCLVIGSDTPPVREILNSENGLLTPFFDTEQLAARVIEALTPSSPVPLCSRAGPSDNSRAIRLSAHLSAENDGVHTKGE
jgi:hypothetical protein